MNFATAEQAKNQIPLCENCIEITVCILYILGQKALLSVLLNWFKLVYGPFGQINMHHTL
jgi:hypothetical protein